MTFKALFQLKMILCFDGHRSGIQLCQAATEWAQGKWNTHAQYLKPSDLSDEEANSCSFPFTQPSFELASSETRGLPNTLSLVIVLLEQ